MVIADFFTATKGQAAGHRRRADPPASATGSASTGSCSDRALSGYRRFLVAGRLDAGTQRAALATAAAAEGSRCSSSTTDVPLVVRIRLPAFGAVAAIFWLMIARPLETGLATGV